MFTAMKTLLANQTGNAIGHGTRKGWSLDKSGTYYHDTTASACQGVSWSWQGLPLPR